MDLNFDNLHLLLFLLPGFVVVWTYRYFTKNANKGDFEYLALSFVWGIIYFAFTAYLGKHIKFIGESFNNNYSAAMVLIMFAFPAGWVGYQVVKFFKYPKVKAFFKNL